MEFKSHKLSRPTVYLIGALPLLSLLSGSVWMGINVIMDCVLAALIVLILMEAVVVKGTYTLNIFSFLLGILFVYILVGILQVETSEEMGQALALLLMIACLILVAGSSYSKDDIRFIATIQIILGVLISVILLTASVPYNEEGRKTIQLFYPGRPRPDPNFLAATICMPSLLSFARMAYSKKAGAIVKYAACFLISILGILQTGSRAAFLSIVVGLALTFVYLAVNRFSRTITGVFVLIFICCIIFVGGVISLSLLPQEMINRLFFSYMDESNQYRLQYWRNGIELIGMRPIFGYGMQSFDKVAREVLGQAGDVHNTNLMFLFQMGVTGFLPFITLWVLLVMKSLRKNRFFLLSILSTSFITSFIISSHRAIFYWYVILWAILVLEYLRKNKNATLDVLL